MQQTGNRTYGIVRTIGMGAYIIAALCLMFLMGYEAGEEDATARIVEVPDDKPTSILCDDPE